MMQQHMGSGSGAMGGWMGWGFWLPVLVALLLAVLVALLALGVLRRSMPPSLANPEGPPAGPLPANVSAILEALPEAEAAVLRPVLESPGISQPEVVHRSGYSKALVSQVLSGLEGRGLVHRVKDGKLYRVYPARAMEGKPGQVNGPERK